VHGPKLSFRVTLEPPNVFFRRRSGRTAKSTVIGLETYHRKRDLTGNDRAGRQPESSRYKAFAG